MEQSGDFVSRAGVGELDVRVLRLRFKFGELLVHMIKHVVLFEVEAHSTDKWGGNFALSGNSITP